MQTVQQHFKRCLLYAREIMRHPETKSYYKALASASQTAFNAAFIDAFYPPRIRGIVLLLCEGRQGDPLIIRTAGRRKVQAVKVEIFDDRGKCLETGLAVRQNNRRDWIYTLQQHLPKSFRSLVRFTAVDLPGNTCTVEKRL